MGSRVKKLPIYRSGYQLVLLAMKETKAFSRDLRPTLGRRIQDDAVHLVLDIYKANASQGKVEELESLLERLQALELSFQLAFDLRLINTKALADAMDIIIFSGRPESLALVPPHKSLFNAPHDRGLPIGNLTSQFFANVYLNALDQFIKHQIRPLGYARYVDDFVLLHPNPAWLTAAQRRIEEFLDSRLKLAVNPRKTIIQPVAHGVDFVGHVIKPWHTIPRRTLPARAVATARSADEAMPERLNSYLGLMRQTKSHNARAALCREALRQGYSVDHRFTKVYRRAV